MPSFYQAFADAAERWPQNIAVEMQRADAVESYSYAELRQMAESVGAWIRKDGLQRGERCAILADNSPHWVASSLGVTVAGGVVVPLDTAFNAQQVTKLLKDSGSSYLFTDTKHLATARAAIAGLSIRLLMLDGSEAELPKVTDMFRAGSAGFMPAEIAADDIAVILYTSGTTSDPKGVMLTHDNLLGEIDSVFRFIKIGPTDAILGVLPLFHALAQMANLLLPFAAGCKVVYLESLNTTELMRALRERDITLFCCVPQFFYLIHEKVMRQIGAAGRFERTIARTVMSLARVLRPLGINLGKRVFAKAHDALGTKMRYLITGGSRFDTNIGRDLYALGFNILQAYGLTETSGGAVATPPSENVIGSVGKPLPLVEVKILDPQPASDGEGPPVGEIAIRGRIIMKGYYNRPDATAAVLQDGWLHSGDLGYLDQRGNLFITGRRKDVIVLSSGKNIYPEEIEAHYQQSPYIKEICVLGIESAPGEPLSERLHAVIVPNFEILRERKIVNAREVIRFDIENLSGQLPSTKRILSYDLWQEDLPRTTTRKLKRYEIQQRVQKQQAATQQHGEDMSRERQLTTEDKSWTAQPEVVRALAIVRQAIKDKREVIHPADNLELDLGLDSMERVELVVALEQALGASVDDSVVSQVYTVRELVDAVRAGVGKESTRRESVGWASVLATESADPDVLALEKPQFFRTAAWFLFGRVVNLLSRLFFRLEVHGLEKLPKNGPYIISPNHQSFLEAPILVSLLPWRIYKQLFYVGTSEIFGGGILRSLARSIKLIPVDPDANLVPAMRAGAYGLRRGKILVLFPEGERSIDGRPRVFKKGAAILGTHMNVPVVPVAVAGFYESWPRGEGFKRFHKAAITIGDPLPPPVTTEGAEAVYESYTDQLRRRVTEMWSEIQNVVAGRAAAKAAAE